MTRALIPGSVNDMTRTVVRTVGGLESASMDIGLSVSTISKSYSDDDDRSGGLGVKYLHQLGRITPAAAVPVAEHFARLAGGVFLPVPVDGQPSIDLYQMAKEFADVVAKHTESHSMASPDPSRFTRKEAYEQLIEGRELMQACALYCAALEAVVGAKE